LLGNFLKAAEDMQQAAKLTGNSPELIFDQKVMQWLASLLQRYIVSVIKCRKINAKMNTSSI
jgi:hypothetical protein